MLVPHFLTAKPIPAFCVAILTLVFATLATELATTSLRVVLIEYQIINCAVKSLLVVSFMRASIDLRDDANIKVIKFEGYLIIQ